MNTPTTLAQQAHGTPVTTTRRLSLVGALGAGLALVSVSTARAAAQPEAQSDAELIAACSDAAAANRIHIAAVIHQCGLPGFDPGEAAAEAEYRRTLAIQNAHLAQVCAIKPHGIAGHAAMARLAQSMAEPHDGDLSCDSEPLVYTIIDNLAAGHQGSLGVDSPFVRAHPDAALMTACAEFDAWSRQRADYCKIPERDQDEAVWNHIFVSTIDAQNAMIERLCVPATTREGQASRARSLELLEAYEDTWSETRTTQALISAMVRDLMG